MSNNTVHNNGALLTYQDTSRETNISVPTLRRWARQGKLPVVRLSATLVRIRREDVQKLIEESMV